MHHSHLNSGIPTPNPRNPVLHHRDFRSTDLSSASDGVGLLSRAGVKDCFVYQVEKKKVALDARFVVRDSGLDSIHAS